jgi:hypothetical protein
VLRKFFPRDKNYILEQAQLSLEDQLLGYLLDYVKVEYLLHHNPLGLVDNIVLRIQQHQSKDLTHLHEFYLCMSGVFRYLHYSDNQLQFSFDGQDDFHRYQNEWCGFFKARIKEFCKQDSFRRAILDLTVFYPDHYTPQMAGLRLSIFITRLFDLKVDAQKGILKKTVA